MYKAFQSRHVYGILTSLKEFLFTYIFNNKTPFIILDTRKFFRVQGALPGRVNFPVTLVLRVRSIHTNRNSNKTLQTNL